MSSNTTTSSLLDVSNLPAPQPQQPQQPQAQGGLDVPSFIQTARQKGVPDQQTYTYLQQNGMLQQPQQPQETAQLHDTGSFLGNVGNSISNFVGGVGNAVFHPLDTAKNIGQTALGLGGQVTNAVGLTDFSGDNIKHAQAIEGFIKQRYGSLEAAGKTAYQDPVGFLSDASILLSGGGSLVGKVGDLSKADEIARASKFAEITDNPALRQAALDYVKNPGGLSSVGQTLTKAGEAINPISIGAKALNNPVTRGATDFAGRQVANAFGITTGAGGSSVKGIFNTAREDGFSNDAINAARGNVSESQIVDVAQQALDNLKTAKNTTYQQQLSKVKDVAGEMDYTPAVEEFRTQLANNGITVKGDTLNFDNARGFQNPSEQAVLQNTYDKVVRWGDLPKNNTLYGLDTLKQQLGDFYEQAQGKARPVIAQVKSSLSDILKTNDEYKNLVEPYESTSNIISDLKSNLSLNAKNPETIFKKLTQAVKQDNEFRQSFIEELSKSAPNKENIMAQISGLNMKDWVNTNKLSGFLEYGSVLFHPSLWPGLLAASPRVVAEFMNTLGWSAGKIDTALDFIKQYKSTVNATTQVNKASKPKETSSRVNPQKTILVKRPKSIP